MGDGGAGGDLLVAGAGVRGEVAHDRAGAVGGGVAQCLREICRARRRGLGEVSLGGF